MVKRKRQYNGQQEKTIQWSTEKDNSMVNRKNHTMVNRKRQYNGQQEKTIQWSTEKDNIMVNRKRQYNNQQKKTIQRPTGKDNTMVNRKRIKTHTNNVDGGGGGDFRCSGTINSSVVLPVNDTNII